MQEPPNIDALDREMIAILQEEGRLSLTDLASRIGLNTSTVHRRVRDLEHNGVIVGYRAVVDPASLGLTFETLISFTLRQVDRATVLEFETALAAVPEVLEADRLSGDPDYLARVRTADLATFLTLQEEVLTTMPGVLRVSTTLVMKHIVDGRL